MFSIFLVFLSILWSYEFIQSTTSELYLITGTAHVLMAFTVVIIITTIIIIVTQPFYESHVNWVVDPVPPASRCPVSEESAASTTAHKMPPSGEETQPPRRQKSRRRRRRKAKRSANQRPASRPADVMTQAAPTANSNSAHWKATRPRSEANDRPEMRKHPLSFTSSPLSQPPSQQPIRMENGLLARTTLKIWGFISRPQLTPGRI